VNVLMCILVQKIWFSKYKSGPLRCHKMERSKFIVPADCARDTFTWSYVTRRQHGYGAL